MATLESALALPSNLQLSIAKYERCLMKLRQDDLQEKLLLATYNLELTQAKRIRDNLKSVLRVWRAKQLECNEENQNFTVASSSESNKEDQNPKKEDVCTTHPEILKNDVANNSLTEEEALEPVQCQHITEPIVNPKDNILEKLEKQQLAFIKQQEEICKQIATCQENLKLLISRENKLEKKDWSRRGRHRSAGTQSSLQNLWTPQGRFSYGYKSSGAPMPLSSGKKEPRNPASNGTPPFDNSLPLSLHAGDQQFSPVSEREIDGVQDTPTGNSSVLSLVANLESSDIVSRHIEVSAERSYGPLLHSERIASLEVCDHGKPIAGDNRATASSLSVKTEGMEDQSTMRSESVGKRKSTGTDQWKEEEETMPEIDHETSTLEQIDVRGEDKGSLMDRESTDSKTWKNPTMKNIVSQEAAPETASKATVVVINVEEIPNSEADSDGNEPSCEGKVEESQITRTQEDFGRTQMKDGRAEAVPTVKEDQEQVKVVGMDGDSDEAHDSASDHQEKLVIKTKRKRRKRICYRSPVKKKKYRELRNFADPEEPLVEVSFCYKKVPCGNVVPSALAQSVVAEKQDKTLCKGMTFAEATLLAGDSNLAPVDFLTVSPKKGRRGKKARDASKDQEKQKMSVEKEMKSNGTQSKDRVGLDLGTSESTDDHENNVHNNRRLSIMKNKRTPNLSSQPRSKGNVSATPINKKRLATTGKGASRSKKGDVATSLSSGTRNDVKTLLQDTRGGPCHSPCFNVSTRRMASAKFPVASGTKSAASESARRTSSTYSSCTVRGSFTREVANGPEENGKAHADLCAKSSLQAESKSRKSKKVQKSGGRNDILTDTRSEVSLSKMSVATPNAFAHESFLARNEGSQANKNPIYKEAKAREGKYSGNYTEIVSQDVPGKRRGNKTSTKAEQIRESPAITRKTGRKGKTNVERSPKARKPQTRPNNRVRNQPTRSAKQCAQKEFFYHEETVDGNCEALPESFADDATHNLKSDISLQKEKSPNTVSSPERDSRHLNVVLVPLENIPEEEASLSGSTNDVQVKETSTHPVLFVSPQSKQLVKGLVDTFDKETGDRMNGKMVNSVTCEIKGKEAPVRQFEEEDLGAGITVQVKDSKCGGSLDPEPDQGMINITAKSNKKVGVQDHGRKRTDNQEKKGLDRSRENEDTEIAKDKTLNAAVDVKMAPTPCVHALLDSRRITRSVARQRSQEVEKQQQADLTHPEQAAGLNVSYSSIQDSSVFVQTTRLRSSAEEASKSTLRRRNIREGREADSFPLKTAKTRPHGKGKTEKKNSGSKAADKRSRTAGVTKTYARSEESTVLSISAKTTPRQKRLASAPSHTANEDSEDSPCCNDFRPKKGRQTNSSTSTDMQRQSLRLQKQAALCLESKLDNDSRLLPVSIEGSEVTDQGQRLNLKGKKGSKGKKGKGNKDETSMITSKNKQQLSGIDVLNFSSTKRRQPLRQRSVSGENVGKRGKAQDHQGLTPERGEVNDLDINGPRSDDRIKLPSSCEDIPAEGGELVMTGNVADRRSGEMDSIKSTLIVEKDTLNSEDQLLHGEEKQSDKSIELNLREKEEAKASSPLKTLGSQGPLKESEDKEVHVRRTLRKRTKDASSQNERSFAPGRVDNIQTTSGLANNTFAKKKRKTLFNAREHSLMTSGFSGFLVLQDTMNGTATLGNRTNTSSMPPSLAKFLKSFVAPKLKQPSTRSSTARCSKGDSNPNRGAKPQT